MKLAVSNRPQFLPCSPPKHTVTFYFQNIVLYSLAVGFDTRYWNSLWKDTKHRVLMKFQQKLLKQKLEEYIQRSLNLLVGSAGVTVLWTLGTLMWPYFCRTLPVSSQPEISPQQELSEDAKQDTNLSAPPRPGTVQSDSNCTLLYRGNRIFIVHCMSTRWQQLLTALLTRRTVQNKEEWLWNDMNQQLFAYRQCAFASLHTGWTQKHSLISNS